MAGGRGSFSPYFQINRGVEMAKKKSRKYEARMRQRKEANALAVMEARKAAEMAAIPVIVAEIKLEIIDLIKREYGGGLPRTYNNPCWVNLNVRFLLGYETDSYKVTNARPYGDILVDVIIKGAEFFPQQTVVIKYHEYQGLPAPKSAADGTFDKYLLHENCSGYYD